MNPTTLKKKKKALSLGLEDVLRKAILRAGSLPVFKYHLHFSVYNEVPYDCPGGECYKILNVLSLFSIHKPFDINKHL